MHVGSVWIRNNVHAHKKTFVNTFYRRQKKALRSRTFNGIFANKGRAPVNPADRDDALRTVSPYRHNACRVRITYVGKPVGGQTAIQHYNTWLLSKRTHKKREENEKKKNLLNPTETFTSPCVQHVFGLG